MTEVDVEALTQRIETIKDQDARQPHRHPDEPGRPHHPWHRPVHRPEHVEVDGSDDGPSRRSSSTRHSWRPARSPGCPTGAMPDGDRILTTRDCYPPKTFPESVTVIGSGVTGVEFVHMFSSFGSKVTLVVSRQQVLPGKDPEVAAVLEQEFMQRGVKLVMGARAESIERSESGDTRDRSVRRRPCGRVVACRVGDRVGSEHRGHRTGGCRRRGEQVGLRRHQPALRHQRARTSTPPATSAASCHCRRWPRSRAARSRNT